MLDLPMTAFLWPRWRWCKGIHSGRLSILLLAGFMAGLSTLCKYFGLALVPLLAVYALAEKRRMGAWMLPLAVPIVFFALEQTSNYALYGRSIFANAIDIAGMKQTTTAFRIASGLSFAGGCMIALVAFAYHMRPRRRGIAIALALSAPVICALVVVLRSMPGAEELPVSSVAQLVVTVLGGVILFALTIDELRSKCSPASFCSHVGWQERLSSRRS